jgi:hypothetical protein
MRQMSKCFGGHTHSRKHVSIGCSRYHQGDASSLSDEQSWVLLAAFAVPVGG